MKTAYSNYDELIGATKLIKKVKLKTPFLYEVNITEINYLYMIDSYDFDRLRRSVAPKYNIRNLKQFQYEKKINIVINSVNYNFKYLIH